MWRERQCTVSLLLFALSLNCGTQDLLVACGHLVAACKIDFPGQGLNPGPLHWELRVLTTGPPRKFWPFAVFYSATHSEISKEVWLGQEMSCISNTKAIIYDSIIFSNYSIALFLVENRNCSNINYIHTLKMMRQSVFIHMKIHLSHTDF